MDVRCTRCSTEYEFEDDLVSSRGTTVKCTHCGHLFKVNRPEEEEESPGTKGWSVRRPDGSVRELESLGELTRLIGDGSFSEQDEISRSGEAWKKLGEIDELSSFFRENRVRRSTRGRSATPALGLRRPQAPSPATLPRGVGSTPPPAPPPGTEPLRFETMGSDVDLAAAAPGYQPAQASAATAPEAPIPAPGEAPVPAPPAAPAPEAPPDVVTAAAVTPPAPPPPTPAPGPMEAAAPSASRRGFPILLLLILLLGGGTAGFLVLTRPPAPAPAPVAEDNPIAALVEKGDAALASHRLTRFGSAVTAYSTGLETHGSDPHLLSSLSRTYAVWSQSLDFQLRAIPKKAPAAERESLERERAELTAKAKNQAELAARKNPGNEEAEVALADALRLTGNLVGARSELDRARATEGLPAAETLRVAALLDIAEAGGDSEKGLELANQAARRDPAQLRARELLAHVLIETRRWNGASTEIEAIRTLDARHPVIALLERRLSDGKEAEAQATQRAEAETRAKGPGSGGRSGGGEGGGHDALISRAEALMERGKVRPAKKAYEKALQLSPGSAQAKTGLGYVALERSQPALAIAHFRPAAGSGHAEAFIGLGDAYRRLGRTRDALRQYQTYVRRFPRGRRISIARRQIQLLQEQVGVSNSPDGLPAP